MVRVPSSEAAQTLQSLRNQGVHEGFFKFQSSFGQPDLPASADTPILCPAASTREHLRAQIAADIRGGTLPGDQWFSRFLFRIYTPSPLQKTIHQAAVFLLN